MTVIDVGPGAVNASSAFNAGYTDIDKGNPANATGLLNSFEIWHYQDGTGVKMGTFGGSGTSYSLNDFETLGNVTSGSKQTFTGLICSVTLGDFIGWYAATGSIETGTELTTPLYEYAGDTFHAGSHTYDPYNNKVSLYATGSDTVSPTVTTQAASSITSTTCLGNGNITDEGTADVTRRGFCYKAGTTGDPTTADSVAYDDGSFSTGAYTKTISGLTPITAYRVRAYCVNSVGTSYGSTVQVYTIYKEEFTRVVFTSTPGGGTWTVPAGCIMATVLVVAGGGAAGATNAYGGGGGGGGLVYHASKALAPGTTVTVTVGAAAQDSVFDDITALAGGEGKTLTAGGNGGSGGGAQNTGGTATQGASGGGTGYGNNGGIGGAAGEQAATGGGGGAGAVGGNGNPDAPAAGPGGAGKDYSSIFGFDVGQLGWFAGGGAGCYFQGMGYRGTTDGTGNGAANTGGGGGAASVAGYSGVVIVQYLTTPPYYNFYPHILAH